MDTCDLIHEDTGGDDASVLGEELLQLLLGHSFGQATDIQVCISNGGWAGSCIWNLRDTHTHTVLWLRNMNKMQNLFTRSEISFENSLLWVRYRNIAYLCVPCSCGSLGNSEVALLSIFSFNTHWRHNTCMTREGRSSGGVSNRSFTLKGMALLIWSLLLFPAACIRLLYFLHLDLNSSHIQWVNNLKSLYLPSGDI